VNPNHEVTPGDGITLRDYLDVIRRRRGLILLVTILVFVVAIIVSARQEVRYSATAQVLEPRTSTTGASTSTLLERSAEAEARLARTPAIVDGVLAAADADLTADEFRARSSVDLDPDSDVLDFTVTAESAELAVELVNTYADEFVSYRADVADDVFEGALSLVEASLLETEEAFSRARALPSTTQSDTQLLALRYQELLDEQQRLISAQALFASSLVSVPAERAVRAGPQTLRNTLLALALGLVLGTVLAFVREALDPRVRSAEEIRDRLGLPLLASIPKPPRPRGWHGRLVMIESPTGAEAEAFRILRTNLDLARQPFETVMLTSASASDGRTTTLANLAIALARSGQDVILVDLDLRRPSLGRLFKLGEGRPGVTDVALKRARLANALIPIAFSDTDEAVAGKGSEEWQDVEGTLHVLPAGAAPPVPGDFLGTHLLTDVLHTLVERTDFVLVDSPPILTVADAVTLGRAVDAVVVTVRVDARRDEIDELRRILDACSASKLGFVLTGVDVGAPSASDSHEITRQPARETRAVEGRSVVVDNPT
jgi:polysaccharide biosynthesis transport protein